VFSVVFLGAVTGKLLFCIPHSSVQR